MRPRHRGYPQIPDGRRPGRHPWHEHPEYLAHSHFSFRRLLRYRGPLRRVPVMPGPHLFDVSLALPELADAAREHIVRTREAPGLRANRQQLIAAWKNHDAQRRQTKGDWIDVTIAPHPSPTDAMSGRGDAVVTTMGSPTSSVAHPCRGIGGHSSVTAHPPDVENSMGWYFSLVYPDTFRAWDT